MRIQVRCFAAVRELFGTERLELELPPGTTLAGLQAELRARQPELARLEVAYARNLAYAAPDDELRDGDEVALIPPISGGAPQPRLQFSLQREPIELRALEQAVRSDADGAVLTFAGVTRDHHDGQAVLELDYEAYPEMAQCVADRLLAQAAEQFPIGRVRIVHRVGRVPIGEASIAVVVAAAHRAAAFDACRWLMDRIKAELPVFKRERLARGGQRWVGELPRPEPPSSAR